MTSNPSPHEEKKAKLLAEIERGRQAQQELRVLEQYEAVMRGEALHQLKGSQVKGSTLRRIRPVSDIANLPFRDLTKGEAAEVILKESGGPLIAPVLFKEMKKRGHPVQSIEALRSRLKTDARFVKIGTTYDLASRRPV